LLQNRQKFQRVQFWGKILTSSGNDYYIAQGFSKEHSLSEGNEGKVSFFSVDGGVTWMQLSQIQDFEQGYLDKIRGYFKGDPSFTYNFDKTHESPDDEKVEEAPKEAPKEEDGEDGEGEGEGDEEAKKPAKPVVQIKEETRLRYVVDNIDNDTSVVPRGAYILKPDERVVENQTFQGLNEHDSGKLSNYIHFRQPRSQDLKSALEKDSLTKCFDFADTIDNDFPSKAWTLQFDATNNVVCGKSLLWPGYVFYHVPQTNTYGSYYIGDGCKNLDLLFMTRDITKIPPKVEEVVEAPEPVLVNKAQEEEEDE